MFQNEVRRNKFEASKVLFILLQFLLPVSIIAKRGYQDNFKPVYFFLRKDFAVQKSTHKQTLTNKTTLSKH